MSECKTSENKSDLYLKESFPVQLEQKGTDRRSSNDSLSTDRRSSNDPLSTDRRSSNDPLATDRRSSNDPQSVDSLKIESPPTDSISANNRTMDRPRSEQSPQQSESKSCAPKEPELYTPENDLDVRLMLKVQQDDALAFEELMLRNQNRVHALLQNMVGNWQMAEDLTQEVFLRIYRARESYAPNAPFSTWMCRIVHNVALNALRSKQRHPELLFSGASGKKDNQAGQSGEFAFEDTILARSALLPTRQLDQKEIQMVVRQAIDMLGERQRMALLLHRFEQMSYQEIAEVMELSDKAVKSLLCRARLNLREILKPYMDGGNF